MSSVHRTRVALPLATTAALLALALPGTAQAALPPGTWTSPTVPANGVTSLYGVTAPATGTAWAVGAEQDATVPLILRWNGSGWGKDPLPAGVVPELVDVDATGPRNAWAIGQGDDPAQANTLKWNGRAWKTRSSPFSRPIDLDLDSRGRPWVVGSEDGGRTTALKQWRKGAWTAHDPAPGTALTAVAARTPKDVWVGTQSDVRHWDGRAWTRHIMPIRYPVQSLQILPLAADDVWAYGLPFDPLFSGFTLFHWDGVSWTEHKPPQPTAPAAERFAAAAATPGSVADHGFLGRIAADGAGGLWYQSNTSPWFQHFDGFRWTSVARSVPSASRPYLFDLAQVGDTTEIWGAGYLGNVPVIDHFS